MEKKISLKSMLLTFPAFSTNYVSSNSSFSNQIQEQPLDSSSTTQAQPIPARTKTQRPRVPPPSKVSL